MLYKLAWRSFLKQFRNYAVPFLCMTMAVMSFYSFSAITYDSALIKRTSQDVQIEGILNLGNFLVLLIVLVFMLSANRFFIVKRRKEIALYQLFGLKRLRIVGQFLLETFVLNSVSFVIGILLGVILSKFFSMILIKAMALEIDSEFFISFPSILFTANVFLFVYLVLALQNIWILSKKQLAELFSKGMAFPSSQTKVSFWSILFGSMGLIFIGSGYFLAFFIHDLLFDYIGKTHDLWIVFWLPLLILTLCVVGTYLFYRFTIKSLIHLLRKRKKSYQGLTLFMLNNSRVHVLRSWRSLSLTTIVAAIAIAIIGATISLIALNSQMVRNSNPTDFQVRQESLPTLQQVIQGNNGKITNETLLQYKATGSYLSLKVLNTQQTQQQQLINLLTIDNYNEFRNVQSSLPKIQLKTANAAVLFDYSYNSFRGITSVERQIYLEDQVTLDLQKMYPDYLGESFLRYSGSVLVVSQQVFDAVEGIDYTVAMVDVAGVADQEKLNQQLNTVLPLTWSDEIYFDYDRQGTSFTGSIQKKEINGAAGDFSGSNVRMNQTSRFPAIRRARRQAGISIYVALFIGVIVMITTASILMLRQFSEAENEKNAYQLLKKLGVSQKEIRHLIYQQNAWIFVPPILLGTGHAMFAIYVLNQFITSDNYWLAYLFCGIMAGAYLIFYIITAQIYSRIIES
ncbi:FtsX-like permease family protein [Enterococcus massiliensis]|uniref:FtsX-like permease family protein n=1 Tax=Enterococcus massiliensis TaxID=1640685 RepID=UPI00065E09E5|nr:ABC transporter permease [Enterococcus massiliensis]